ncbi:penicillin-binding protein, partial [bacterium]|nr:penicillin-binding protein [bacterium]
MRRKKRFFLPSALNLKKTFSKKWWKRLWRSKRFRRKVLYAGIGLAIVFVGIVAWFSKDLPTPSKIKQWRPPLSTKILDRNGKLLYEVHGAQRRTWIKFDEIPEYMKQATLAAEDKEFYHHFGINFKGLFRALLRDILHRRYKEGGSSITQQFVKNALLTPHRTLSRKIKEAILAIELEILYSKDQILEMYLNTIPYGSNAYGVEAAAQTFFGKSAKDLNLAECALLAALPKAPTYYSPYGSHIDELMARKNYI